MLPPPTSGSVGIELYLSVHKSDPCDPRRSYGAGVAAAAIVNLAKGRLQFVSEVVILPEPIFTLCFEFKILMRAIRDWVPAQHHAMSKASSEEFMN